MERHELKSVLKTLAKFHADGIAFKRKNPELYPDPEHTYIAKYPFLKVMPLFGNGSPVRRSYAVAVRTVLTIFSD